MRKKMTIDHLREEESVVFQINALKIEERCNASLKVHHGCRTLDGTCYVFTDHKEKKPLRYTTWTKCDTNPEITRLHFLLHFSNSV